jgi:hypothetical protein
MLPRDAAGCRGTCAETTTTLHVMQVEDMLKRSFAEWRAQRSQPEAQAAMKEVEAALAGARKKGWPECFSGWVWI